MTKIQLNIMPTGNDDCAISAISLESMNTVLPTVWVRAFAHHYEIAVVDLAGDLVHTIVIRQNGNVEVDE